MIDLGKYKLDLQLGWNTKKEAGKRQGHRIRWGPQGKGVWDFPKSTVYHWRHLSREILLFIMYAWGQAAQVRDSGSQAQYDRGRKQRHSSERKRGLAWEAEDANTNGFAIYLTTLVRKEKHRKWWWTPGISVRLLYHCNQMSEKKNVKKDTFWLMVTEVSIHDTGPVAHSNLHHSVQEAEKREHRKEWVQEITLQDTSLSDLLLPKDPPTFHHLPTMPPYYKLIRD